MRTGDAARLTGALLLCVPLVACTDRLESREPETPASASGGHVATPAGAPDVPWPKKTREERAEYMALFVYPKMKAVFQAHDAKAFADFRCQTCHGEDMERVEFRMPNALYALPAASPVKAAMEYDEKTARFMVDEVEPALEALLGKGDVAAGAQAGCLRCHQTEK